MRHSEKVKRVSIGGQAVIEGVMMRGQSSMAVSVRDADGIIRTEKTRVKPAKERNIFLRLPIIRGVVSFLQSLVGGTKILMRSAEVFGEGEPSKAEKWISEKLGINVMSVVSGISLIIGLALAVFLFMWLPQFVRGLLQQWTGVTFGVWAKNFIEGGLKLVIFVSYILLCSLMKDVRRTFMYHGAEHKTISCYEKGLELTAENAARCTRVHDRCGTTFMVFVMVISILTFALVESLIGAEVERIYRILLKIALLPLVAGLSYELLKGLAKTRCFIFFPLKAPGLLLQLITTREPDKEMLEVAITAFKAVLEMDADPTVPERKFDVPEKRSAVLARVKDKLKANGVEEDAEAEWIVSIVLGIKRDEVNSDALVSPKFKERIDAITEERITGRPLWYCIGDTEFFDCTIKVDERALIPRPETELLVERAIKDITPDSSVLDLCTGSGAIAIAVAKKTGAKVTASDISEDALALAAENAAANGVEVKFIKSDLFGALDGKFDVIITNPPYIKSGDIPALQREIRQFEPLSALDGGEDGLDFYRRIAKEAKGRLNAGGKILLECGAGQARDVADMFKDYGKTEIYKDYENIERIVRAAADV